MLAAGAAVGATNRAVAASGEVVTLPPDDGGLEKRLAQIESKMRVGDLSKTGGLEEPYSGFAKQYADCFAGVAYFNDAVTVYTTDTDAPLIKELAGDPDIVIKKATHSLNRLNRLALDLMALADAGRINGYSSPPYVDVRNNRVVLNVWKDETLPGGLSPEALMKELAADASILHIGSLERYPEADGVATMVPKTGGAPAPIGPALFLLAAALACVAGRRTRKKS